MIKSKLFSTTMGFILVVICFLPILKSGLYSDDLHNFQLRAASPKLQEESVYALAEPEIALWKNYGRYTPLSFYWMEFVYKYFTTIADYKCFVFLINILAVIIFLVYLSQLKLNINYSIWLVCFAAVVQYRITYHDAYTSLNGIYQLLAITVFAALIFYHYYLLKGALWLLLLSVLLFICSIFISEIGLLVLLLIPISAIIFKVPIKKLSIIFLPFFIITIAYLIYIAWLRMHVNQKDVYFGLTANYDLGAMVNLLVKQILASFPLTNLYHKRAIPNILIHQLTYPQNIISILAIVTIAFFAYRKYSEQKISQTLSFNYLLVSVSLIIFPALFILPSLKYQTEVQWGVGYLPVYFQNFGSATLLAFLFQYGINNYRNAVKKMGTYIYIFIVTVTCITFLFNNALINACSYNTSFPAEIFYEKIKEGALKNCKNGSTIILGHDFFWKSPELYQKIFKDLTGKDFTIIDNDVKLDNNDSIDVFYLDCKMGDKVIVSLYKLNPNNKELIIQTETNCDIELIEAENNMFH